MKQHSLLLKLEKMRRKILCFALSKRKKWACIFVYHFFPHKNVEASSFTPFLPTYIYGNVKPFFLLF